MSNLKKFAFYMCMSLGLLLVLELSARVYIHGIRRHELRDHYYGGKAYEFYHPTYLRLRPNAFVKSTGYRINQQGLLSDMFGETNQEIRIIAVVHC
jgi:hypothetical protein